MQHVRGANCLEWAADMIAKVHDLGDAIGGYIGKYGLKREPISVHIGAVSMRFAAIAVPVARPTTISCGKSVKRSLFSFRALHYVSCVGPKR
jgi:hypothetical protein